MLKRKFFRLAVTLIFNSFVFAIHLIGLMGQPVLDAYSPYQLHKKIPDDGTKVHFIQLTNGEATLIQFENHRTALIDTGSYSSQHQLFTYLEEQGIADIDYLVLTNLEDEHAGNLEDLVEDIQIRQLYFPYSMQNDIEEQSFLQDIELYPLKRGQKVEWDKEIGLHVLHPSDNLELSPQNNSLVFQLQIENNSFLFTSDITEKVEQELTGQFDLHSQILKVSDFGSNQGSHPDFIAEVDAHVAVIFHRPNFYLHPDVVERLEESWMDVYALKKHGHLLIVTYKDDYDVFVIKPSEDFQQ